MNSQNNKKQTLIIAHRGASAHAPENTLAAFKMALDMGADGIELDVMLSQDKELVVIHDDTVDRTTNGSGRVKDFSYRTLKDLDAGKAFAERFSGEHVPTLAEVFEQLGGKLLINVELKNYASPFDDLTYKVIDLVESNKLADSVILSSFNPLNLSRAFKRNPAIRRGLLTFPKALGSLLRGPAGRLFPYNALHPYFADVNKRMIDHMHSLGRQVNVWTVDDPVELRLLSQMGVDMIICNDPLGARQVLGNL
jgi:glycerophosphoryl diester phosphodiesterase